MQLTLVSVLPSTIYIYCLLTAKHLTLPFTFDFCYNHILSTQFHYIFSYFRSSFVAERTKSCSTKIHLKKFASERCPYGSSNGKREQSSGSRQQMASHKITALLLNYHRFSPFSSFPVTDIFFLFRSYKPLT